ncbi:uncharacterized protein LOC127879197 isoform X2 [Dreissena polymorpha]|uniref:uncharacterized protein LOC127879197 isoform X2 n=1 Tax=Dreissena polymorpha TaxID=45954 RepID=UPI00226500B9|nr:uncharacterized protein LOC127879197 isoform X2 [Dreissena polymorpha]XP_052281857.1 uncharacterized protein LOC127879197 isoform X2 [Dreissena polymorpha]
MKLSVTTVAPFVTAPPQPTNHCFDKLSTCSQYDLATQTHVSTQETITERASSGKIAAHTIVHARTGTVITLKARHCGRVQKKHLLSQDMYMPTRRTTKGVEFEMNDPRR